MIHIRRRHFCAHVFEIEVWFVTIKKKSCLFAYSLSGWSLFLVFLFVLRKNSWIIFRRFGLTYDFLVCPNSQILTNQSQTSSSSSSRVAKSSQRILTSSSSSEMKASSMKSDLTELKRGISEMKNMSTNFSQRLRNSMENLVDRSVFSFKYPFHFIFQSRFSQANNLLL